MQKLDFSPWLIRQRQVRGGTVNRPVLRADKHCSYCFVKTFQINLKNEKRAAYKKAVCCTFSSHGLNFNKYQIIKALYPLTLYMQVNKNSNTNTIKLKHGKVCLNIYCELSAT